ncbi:hypothetical protein ASF61_22290 [Duganella sp. Leaf126]|nr:hypothetical protein ASF61_22290 [Duganella sp. Leaf126]
MNVNKTASIDFFADLARQHPSWRWYAIADSAQNPALPAALTGAGGTVQSLLGATQGSPLAEKSPHLVSLDHPAARSAAWQWIMRTGPHEPSVTLLASTLAFGALFEQLKQFTDIRLPDDTEMFFAFWDPAILGTLVGQPDDATLHVKGPVLDPDQRKLLCGGLNGWWYWDRDGVLHAIAIDANPPAVRLPKPIKLSQAQVDELVEASLPDHVLFYVDLNQPHLLDDLAPRARYGYVERQLTDAKHLGLQTMKDLVNYVCMTLVYGARWKQDKTIADVLARVQRRELKFSAAMELLP